MLLSCRITQTVRISSVCSSRSQCGSVRPRRTLLPFGRRQLRVSPVRASEDDKIIGDMKKAAEQGDIWSGEFAGVITKVGGVAIAAAVVTFLVILSQPMINYTVDAFPGQQQQQGFELD